MKNNIEHKIRQLSELIDETILPLIKSDFVLWGLPYYINPGDTLIWEGTLQMLRKSHHKCLGTLGWNELEYIPLAKETVILVVGGGFFGDIWRNAWEFVMNQITQYANNPIVILPQSIYYQNYEIAMDDANRLSKLKHLTICTRDRQSYEFACKNFSNDVFLVPDMAFHCNLNKLQRYAQKQTEKVLFLKRTDREQSKSIVNIEGEHVDTKDWPSMELDYSLCMKAVNKLINKCNKVSNRTLRHRLIALCYKYGQRNVVIRDAVLFISPYKEVYTTRLHVMILSVLLGKKIYILDNLYGKVSDCYKTWLHDLDHITLL